MPTSKPKPKPGPNPDQRSTLRDSFTPTVPTHKRYGENPKTPQNPFGVNSYQSNSRQRPKLGSGNTSAGASNTFSAQTTALQRKMQQLKGR